MIHKPHTSERKLGNSGRMCVFQPLYVRHWMFSPLTWSQFCATWYQCYLKLSKPSLHLVLCLPLFYVCPLCQCPEGEAGCPAVVCSSCSLSILLMSMRQVCLFLFKTYSLYVDSLFYIHSMKKHMGTPSRSTLALVLVLVLPKYLFCEISWKPSLHRL